MGYDGIYRSRVVTIPPFMMHGNVVQGVMSFPEMDAMMYKIEGEINHDAGYLQAEKQRIIKDQRKESLS